MGSGSVASDKDSESNSSPESGSVSAATAGQRLADRDRQSDSVSTRKQYDAHKP